MAIQEVSKQETGGFKKTIEASAMNMMLSVLQGSQYQFPIKSTVRELVCNGIDAISEREMAKSILNGVSKVEDYYVTREGDIYADSKFDSSYYDTKFLSDENKVKIVYTENTTGRDTVSIQDFGVGLYGRRLEGYFSLGFSSKRLNKLALGKFGLGNKVALSVMPYYTMITIYNGKKFKFNIFNSSVQSLVPKFNLETGTENPFYTCTTIHKEDGSPEIFYYENTEEKNGTTIFVEAKHNHRQQYIEAVKSQLGYFTNVEMVVKKEGGFEVPIDYKTAVLYENDKLIVSSGGYWSKPHILINNVNYGFINFDELEMQSLYGNLGIKVDAEEIEVSPSRESILWTEKTKEMVLKRFDDVVDMASEMVKDRISTLNFIEWLKSCKSVMDNNLFSSNNQHGDVLRSLSGVIDKSKLSLKFKGDSSIIYGSRKFNKTLNCIRVYKSKDKIAYDTVYLSSIDLTRTYISYDKDLRMNNKVNKFLRHSTGEEFFIITLVKLTPDDSLVENLQEFQDKIVRHFQNSESPLPLYESVVVPDSFNETDEEDITVTNARGSELTPEQKRALEGKVVIHNLRKNVNGLLISPDASFFINNKIEPKLKDLGLWDNEEIYYGNDEDIPLLHLAGFLCTNIDTRQIDVIPLDKTDLASYSTDYLSGYTFHQSDTFTQKSIRLYKCAKSLVSSLPSNHKNIKRFFFDIQNNKVTMANHLINWYTCSKMKKDFHKLIFLRGFESINKERFDQFMEIFNYYKKYSGKLSLEVKTNSFSDADLTDLVNHMDRIAEFQYLVKCGASKDEISSKAKELWDSEEIEDANAINFKMYESFKDLLDWADSIYPMLNSIQAITGHYSYKIPDETSNINGLGSLLSLDSQTELAIREYLELKQIK